MEPFESYLTYDEYVELGGELPEDAFTKFERKAQRWLDYITFDRIKHLTVIPNEVKEVLAEFVDKLNSYAVQKANGDSIKQYSNTVETITYSVTSDEDAKKELFSLANAWLPDYLTYRGMNFNVDEYLQRNSDNP